MTRSLICSCNSISGYFQNLLFRQIDVVFYNLAAFSVFGQFWLHLGRLDKQMLSYAIVNLSCGFSDFPVNQSMGRFRRSIINVWEQLSSLTMNRSASVVRNPTEIKMKVAPTCWPKGPSPILGPIKPMTANLRSFITISIYVYALTHHAWQPLRHEIWLISFARLLSPPDPDQKKRRKWFAISRDTGWLTSRG